MYKLNDRGGHLSWSYVKIYDIMSCRDINDNDWHESMTPCQKR
jgi:hypothetical protein